MKVGFIGLGRMGEVMVRRLLGAWARGRRVQPHGREDEAADRRRRQADGSIRHAAKFGEAVFTMLADDAAVLEVAGKTAGLKDSLPPGGIHICAGTHSVAAIAKLTAIHAEAGQILPSSPCCAVSPNMRPWTRLLFAGALRKPSWRRIVIRLRIADRLL